MNVQPLPGETPFYVGRFLMQLPSGTAVRGQEARVHDMEVEEFRWPADSSGHRVPDAFDEVWNARVAEVRADSTKRPRSAPDALRRVQQVSPSIRMMLRHDDSFGVQTGYAAGYAEALVDARDAGVWVRVNYEMGTDPAEAETLLSRIVPQVARAYTTYPPQVTRDIAEPAFHLLHGAVRLPYEYHEQVTTWLELPRHDAAVTITMVTSVGDGESAIEDARYRQATARLHFGDLELDILRARRRNVAQLPGEETVELAREPGSLARLAFVWEFRGVAGDPMRPHMRLEMETTDEAREAKVALWDRLLDSMQPLPQDGER